MKLYYSTILTLVLGLSGCAQVALYHDRADPCQGEHASPERKAELGRPADYKRPDYCFASHGRIRAPISRIYTPSGQLIGVVR